MDAAPVPPVPELDTGQIARLREVLAGGHLALEPDRRLAAGILGRWPKTGELVRGANDFHRRAALWAVTGGTPGSPCTAAAGVVFAASGYPSGGGFHAAAKAARPDSLFVYADADEAATAYNRALLAVPDPLRVCARWRSARDPAGLISLPAVQAVLDRGPVMVQLQLCAQWWPPEFAAWAVGEYARLLPPGSTVALSTGIAGGGECAPDFMADIGRGSGRIYPHTAADIAGWVTAAGMTLTPAGVTDVRGRELGWAAAEFSRQRRPARVVEAIAVV